MSFERRKIRVGKVIADKMNKTVIVAVDRKKPHRLYKKAVRRRSRFNAHDGQNEARIGDLVRIIETRPLSKTKRWRITEILSRENMADIQPGELDLEAYEPESSKPVAESEPGHVIIGDGPKQEPVGEDKGTVEAITEVGTESGTKPELVAEDEDTTAAVADSEPGTTPAPVATEVEPESDTVEGGAGSGEEPVAEENRPAEIKEGAEGEAEEK